MTMGYWRLLVAEKPSWYLIVDSDSDNTLSVFGTIEIGEARVEASAEWDTRIFEVPLCQCVVERVEVEEDDIAA